MSPEFRVRDFPDIKIFWMIYFMIADLEKIIIRRCGINHENMRYTRVQMEYTFSLVHLVQPVQQVTAGSHRVVFANKNENKYWE